MSAARRVLMFALAAVAQPAAAYAQSRTEEREANFAEREAWHTFMRAYPSGSYVQNPIAVARAAAVQRGGAGASLLAPWRSLGPFGFQTGGFYGSSPNADGGRIRAVAVHPTNPSIIYAGSASGGVWRTVNGGASWIPLTDNQCSLTTGAVSIDPVDPTIVYVGTGEPTQSLGCGMLRSFDAGNSWTEINGGGVLAPTNGTQTTRAYAIEVDRASAGSRTSTMLLYAATNGLHRSTNSGTTWTTVLSGFVSDVEADPADPNVFWAARVNASLTGIWRSDDRGVTWNLSYSVPSTVQRIALAVSPAAPGRVWGATIVGGRLDALVRHDADSNTTTRLSATGVYGATSRLDFGTQSTYNLVLEVDPTDASIVYVGGSRVYRSRDNGQSFSVIAYDLHVDWHAFEIAPSDPNVIIAGNDGGVFVSYDRANAWMSRNTNISVSQFYPGLAVHPTIPDVMAGGLQDNSSLWGFGSGFWNVSAPTGDGGWNAWSPADPNVFWSTGYTFGNVSRHTRSLLGSGVTYSYRGFDGSDRKQFLPPMVIDPATAATLYYATYRLWRTTNEGLTWAPLTGDLTKGGSGTITSLAVSTADPRVIWVGTSDANVQLSIDGGTTFTAAGTGLPNRFTTDIVADASDPRRAVLTVSGVGSGHVFITTNAGATWTNVSAGLPDIPFNAAVLIPGSSQIIVAADVGIYESTNNGASWSLAAQGFPNVEVTDLVYQQATGILYAGTYGRGIWATQLAFGAAVLRGDVNKDGIVNAFDAAIAQQTLVGIRQSSAVNPMPSGDANCNGTLDAGDVLAILQFAVGAAPANLCVGKLL